MSVLAAPRLLAARLVLLVVLAAPCRRPRVVGCLAAGRVRRCAAVSATMSAPRRPAALLVVAAAPLSPSSCDGGAHALDGQERRSCGLAFTRP